MASYSSTYSCYKYECHVIVVGPSTHLSGPSVREEKNIHHKIDQQINGNTSL
jgi:hypothetical protein